MNPINIRLWTRRRLKKVPLPWAFSREFLKEIQSVPASPFRSSAEIAKLDMIIRGKFDEMYGGRHSLNTAETKEWGAFLAERGISWEIKLPKKPDWEGWEVKDGGGCYVVRLKGLENHIRVNHYFVPPDLAMKMLVLEDLA